MAKKKPELPDSVPSEAPAQEPAFNPSQGMGPPGTGEMGMPGQGMEVTPQSQLDYTPPRKMPRFPGAANPNATVAAEDLVDTTPISEDYVPWGSYGMWGYYGFMNRNRPPFTYYTVREMLTDPRVIFGLWLIKGPIVNQSKYQVDCSRSDVAEYIQNTVRRFMQVGAARVLKALEWGYSASEVEYKYNSEDHLIHFDNIRDLDSLDCRPVTKDGSICGFLVRNIKPVRTSDQFAESLDYTGDFFKPGKTNPAYDGRRYVGFPKGLYHIHQRERNPWFGLSRLYGAHVPWWEQWSEDGYRAIRRLWYLKNSFDGGTLYHPPGQMATTNGPKANRDYAREMLEKRRAGGVLTLPNTTGPDGTGKAWEYVPPSGNPVPSGLLEYGNLLRDEVLEALGIPPEIISSGEGGGFGSSSGRQVPQMAFYSILMELVNWLLLDFDKQVLRYLVALNFGPVQYDLMALPFEDGGVQSHPNDPNAPANPLDPMNQQPSPEAAPSPPATPTA